MTPEGPLVVKLGGALIDDAHAMRATVVAIGALEAVAAGSTVVVHGGGAAVDRQLSRLGMETRRHQGIRITPPEQMEQITGVLAGATNSRLTGALLAEGVRAVGITLASGGLTRARVAVREGVDLGRVGEIAGGCADVAHALLERGLVPVISSIAADARGEPLNVNADDAAVAVARIVGARALVFLTDVPGVRGAEGQILGRLDRSAAESLIASGAIGGGMIPKVRGAIEAAERCGVPVVIAGWADPAALATIAAGGAAGTACVAGPAAHGAPSGSRATSFRARPATCVEAHS
jgi:acetylglutamate kinase